MGERLVLRARMRDVGGASGVEVDLDGVTVWTLRNGLVIREEHYGADDA